MVVKDFIELLEREVLDRSIHLDNCLGGDLVHESFIVAVLDEVIAEIKLDFPTKMTETGFTIEDIEEMVADIEATASLVQDAFYLQLEQTEWDNGILTKVFSKTAK